MVLGKLVLDSAYGYKFILVLNFLQQLTFLYVCLGCISMNSTFCVIRCLLCIKIVFNLADMSILFFYVFQNKVVL